MSLGEKVKETLELAFNPMIDLIETPIKWALSAGLEIILDVLGQRLAPVMKNMVDTIEGTGKVPPELQPILDEIKNPTGEIASLLSFAAARGGLGAVTGNIFTTLTSGIDYSLKASIQPSLLDVKSIIDTERRVAGSDSFTNQEWLWTGFNSQRRDYLREITRPLLGIDHLMNLYRRYPNQASYVDNVLQEYGFKDSDINNLKLTWYQYPGLQDLIHMAVREAFSPDIIAKFGTAADFPEEFAQEAIKQGLTRDWALRYWYAHWNLPSIGQGFEMLHRGVINDDELDTLLRTQDVMPYWREKIKAITYHPLTRVDVRRMHAIGTLNRDQVKKAYRDIGYNEENAELMTQFTERYNTTSERELTKTEILQVYNGGAMDQGEALELLIDLGYDEDTAAYLLDQSSTQSIEEKRNLSLTQVKNLAINGFIDRGTATGKLAELGYTAEDIERIIELWDLEVTPAIRLPSRTDLEQFWKSAIIDDDTWYNEMLKLGYGEDYIVWYYLQMNKEIESNG